MQFNLTLIVKFNPGIIQFLGSTDSHLLFAKFLGGLCESTHISAIPYPSL